MCTDTACGCGRRATAGQKLSAMSKPSYLRENGCSQGLPRVPLPPDLCGFVLTGMMPVVPMEFPLALHRDMGVVARQSGASIPQAARDSTISESFLQR